jgi:hypothetical protein
MLRLRRLRRWWPVVLAIFLVLLVYAAWPGRSTFTVGKETTYITEPLDANGHPDYQAALNERLRQGVTPETNANVLLWQALGPRPEGRPMPPEYFRWLGVEPPPEDGEYLLHSDKYFEAYLKDRPPKKPAGPDGDGPPADRRQQWHDELARTGRWPWKAKDHPDVADWLKRNEKPLAVVAEAARRPKYYNPVVSGAEDPTMPRIMTALMPNVQKCRELANALASRAMRRLGEGDADGAWQDLMTCQRLGRHVGGGATLIDSLVGIAVVTVAANTQVTLISHGPHPPQRLRGWLSDLRQLPPLPRFADRLDPGERYSILEKLTNIAVNVERTVDMSSPTPRTASAGERLGDRLFTRSIDWDPALRKANRVMDQYAAGARLPDRAARKQEYAKLEDEFSDARMAKSRRSGLGQMAMTPSKRGERDGDILIALLLPSLEKLQDSTDRAEQIQLNLQVALALAAYRADHGRYPVTLAELAPKYLPSVPNDIFSGKPLIYRPDKDGYLLYSVGGNGKDDGGRWTDDDPPGDDPRIRMPVPEPKAKPKPKAVGEPRRSIDID